MITQSESGLSAGNYTTLLASTGDPSFSLELEQYNLSLSSHDSNALGSSRTNFDAIVCGTVIVRASADSGTANTIRIDTLASEDGGDQAWSAQNLTATDINMDVVISLAVSGNTVRVFWYDDTNLKYFESADNGATWGAMQTVGAVSSLEFLAASSTTRCHYLTRTTQNNLRFHVYSYNGSWSSSSSDIYWQFTPSSFDAEVGPQADDGAASTNDLLVFSTDFPPIIGSRVDGTDVNNALNRVQGISLIRYQNGRWSNHYEIDLIDRAPSYPSRYAVRLSVSGAWYFLCYYRVDGTTNYSHTAIALSRSKDGLNWELPYLVTKSIDGPSILLKRGNHAYVLDAYQTYRSASSGYTGDAQTTQDISDYCLSLNSRMGDIQNLQATIANPEQALDSTTPFSSDAILQARYKLGYMAGSTDLKIQTLLADVDALGDRERLPTDHSILTARDMLARLLTVKADRPQEWESTQQGGDDFQSAYSDDYSGLRHTAVQDGTWKAPDGNDQLHLASAENPGVAFTTYIHDAWNGSIQCGLQTASTDSDDYAGVIFRAFDKENFWFARMETDYGRIQLGEWVDGDESIRKQTARIGLESETWRWLKVIFRYGKIYVYLSEDGIDWTEEIDYECAGVASGTSWSWGNLPNLSGRMGYVGYGYSDEDTPPDPPPPPPPPPECENQCLGPDLWSSKMVDGVCVLDELIEANSPACDYQTSVDRVIVGTQDFGVWYTTNFGASSNWTALNDGLSGDALNIIWFARDPVYHRSVGYVLTDDGIYRNDGLDSDGSWVQKLSLSEAADLITIGNRGAVAEFEVLENKIGFRHLKPQICAAGRIWAIIDYRATFQYYSYLIHSDDRGDTWHVNFVAILPGSSCGGVYPERTAIGQLVPSPHNPRLVHLFGTSNAGTSNAQPTYWRLVDGGAGSAGLGDDEHKTGYGTMRLSWVDPFGASAVPTGHVPYFGNPENTRIYLIHWHEDSDGYNYSARRWDQGGFVKLTEDKYFWEDAHTAWSDEFYCDDSACPQYEEWFMESLVPDPVCLNPGGQVNGADITPGFSSISPNPHLFGSYTWDKDRIWFVSEADNKCGVSNDGGDTWEEKTAVPTGNVAECASGFPYDGSIFMVGLSDVKTTETNMIWVSTDGGDTWTDYTGDLFTEMGLGPADETAVRTIAPEW